MRSNNKPPSSSGRCLTCYICGRSQLALTFQGHLSDCKVQFMDNQRGVPRHSRKPLPLEPKGLKNLLGKT